LRLRINHELVAQFIVPLVSKDSWQTTAAPGVPASLEFQPDQCCFNSFSKADLVCQNKSISRRVDEFEDRLELVWVEIDLGRLIE
jgi:hypothetical protein